MTTIRAGASALAAALLLLSGEQALAQQRIARSFEQLEVLVNAGDTITVTIATGEDLSGRVVSLSTAELVIMTGSGHRSFQAGDPIRIRQRRGDSLANGIWTGAGIGVGLVVLGAVADASDSDSFGAGFWIFAGGIYAAMGAGIGAGVDALIRRTHVIYDSRPTPGSSVQIAPLVGTRRIGAAVAWRF